MHGIPVQARRLCGRVVAVPDAKYGGPEFLLLPLARGVSW